jgi:hypothetical protein
MRIRPTLFFQIIFQFQLSIPIDELENKKQIKCIWIGKDLKEQVRAIQIKGYSNGFPECLNR